MTKKRRKKIELTTQLPRFEKFQKRERMVKEQIIGYGITDKRVIQAMLATPRHRFMPEHTQTFAYTDGPIHIGEGQTISQPYVLALMLEKLNLLGNETVLEVGTGSGYTTALIAQLAQKVYSIERIKTLYENAKKNLDQFALKNITLSYSDGSVGWEQFAPYDSIFVGAASPKFPVTLTEQLKIGGTMVVPVGEEKQKLFLLKRTVNGYEKSNNGAVRFVPILKGTNAGS